MRCTQAAVFLGPGRRNPALCSELLVEPPLRLEIFGTNIAGNPVPVLAERKVQKPSQVVPQPLLFSRKRKVHGKSPTVIGGLPPFTPAELV